MDIKQIYDLSINATVDFIMLACEYFYKMKKISDSEKVLIIEKLKIIEDNITLIKNNVAKNEVHCYLSVT